MRVDHLMTEIDDFISNHGFLVVYCILIRFHCTISK